MKDVNMAQTDDAAPQSYSEGVLTDIQRNALPERYRDGYIYTDGVAVYHEPKRFLPGNAGPYAWRDGKWVLL